VKSPCKLCNKRLYLVIIGGLVFAAYLLGNPPAAAQATTTPATTSTPAPSGMASTTTPAPLGKAAATSASAPSDTGTTTPVVTPATSLPTNGAYLFMTDPDNTPPDDTNWVTLGMGSSFVNGDKAQFQREQNTKDGVSGGLEDFHWQQFVGKTGTITVDGHAIVGNHDYDFHLDYTDPSLGYIRAGYTEYRIWYDGNGGYYSPNNESFSSLYDNDLYVDRRNGWIEAGLTLPDLPAFSLRYEYDSRVGFMDSTSWGDNDTGTPGTLPADEKIVPTYLGIDETRNIFQGKMTDHLDNTDIGLTLRYELDETKDSTFIDLDPLNGSSTVAGDQRFVTDYDIEKNDLFNVNGFSETFFDDKVTFSTGFSYMNMDTDLGGSRIYGPNYNAPFSRTYVNNGAGYINLGGFGTTNEYVYNMNLMLKPIKDLVLVPSVRLEYDRTDLVDSFDTTSAAAPVGEAANADNWTLNVAQSLEARYTGFRDWSLYASGEWSEDSGNDSWDSEPILDSDNFNQNWNRLGQKYTVGANWYPLPQLNFGTQYYHQTHEYNYSNAGLNGTEIQYPGYLQKQYFTTDDMNFRTTWMACSTLTLVTRFDFQYSTVDTWALPNTGTLVPGTQVQGVQSCDIHNQIISENVTWTPLARLDLEAGGSYVLNDVNTPVAGSAGVNNIVLNGDNDYWTVNVGAGYAFDDKTDLRVDYTYYLADDFANDASTSATATGTGTGNIGIPYGADTEEHDITATLTHKFNKSLEGSLKYGFSNYRDGTSGGQDNYESQLVYASMKYGF